MTPKQEAAMRQAREALKKCDSALAEELAAWDIDPPLHHVLEASNACGPAITAIDEALAEQPAQQALDKMAENARELGIQMQPEEPRAWFTVDELNAWADKKLKENPQWAEQPAQQQEPVAWSYWQSCLNDDGTQTAPWVHRVEKFKPSESIINKNIVPLYTSPPKRKPLTHPQIHELDWPDGVPFEDILLFARAIEAAHGIKGEA